MARKFRKIRIHSSKLCHRLSSMTPIVWSTRLTSSSETPYLRFSLPAACILPHSIANNSTARTLLWKIPIISPSGRSPPTALPTLQMSRSAFHPARSTIPWPNDSTPAFETSSDTFHSAPTLAFPTLTRSSPEPSHFRLPTRSPRGPCDSPRTHRRASPPHLAQASQPVLDFLPAGL